MRSLASKSEITESITRRWMVWEVGPRPGPLWRRRGRHQAGSRWMATKPMGLSPSGFSWLLVLDWGFALRDGERPIQRRRGSRDRARILCLEESGQGWAGSSMSERIALRMERGGSARIQLFAERLVCSAGGGLGRALQNREAAFLRSRFEEPRIGAQGRTIPWEVDAELDEAQEHARVPFKLRRDVPRLECEIEDHFETHDRSIPQ